MHSNDRETSLLGNFPALLAEWREQYSVFRSVKFHGDSPDEDHEFEELKDPLSDAVALYLRTARVVAPWFKPASRLSPKARTWTQQLSRRLFLNCLYFSVTQVAESRSRDKKAHEPDEQFFLRAWGDLATAVAQDSHWSHFFPSDAGNIPVFATQLADIAFSGPDRFSRLFSVFKAWTAFALDLTEVPFDEDLEMGYPRNLWRADLKKMQKRTTAEWAVGQFAELNKMRMKTYKPDDLLAALSPVLLSKFVKRLYWPYSGLFRSHLELWQNALASHLETQLPKLSAWNSGAYLLELDAKGRRLTNLRSKKSVSLTQTGVGLLLELKESKPVSVYALYESVTGTRPDQIHVYFGRDLTKPLERISAENLLKVQSQKKNAPALYTLDPSALLLIRE